MDPKKDEMILREATKCDHCLCWLKYCDAECCKGFQFAPIGPRSDILIEDGIVKIRIPMTPDRKWYYEIHDVRVEDDVLHIPQQNCRFSGQTIEVCMRCSLLAKDNLCIGHPKEKPEICKDITLDNARNGSCYVSPNCLLKYKRTDTIPE